MRQPKSGTPAFVADVASGWMPTYDDYGSLEIAAEDHSSFILLRIFSDPGLGDRPLPDVAAEVLKGAGATPYARSGPGGIAGRAGESFYSQITSNGVTLDVRLVVVELDQPMTPHWPSFSSITLPLHRLRTCPTRWAGSV
ncbi:MAG TPA: hypothetical protein VG960_04750 [Caulobacteraceae bacterium]|nr:hypothetical protein [Caulobacteraceae bacterium]